MPRAGGWALRLALLAGAVLAAHCHGSDPSPEPVLEPDAAVDAGLLLAQDAGAPDSQYKVPVIRPLSGEQAAPLAAWARALQTRSTYGVALPVAWSSVPTNDPSSAWALQWALGMGQAPLPAASPVMVQTDATDEVLRQVVASAGVETATIELVGPLITAQTLVTEEGAVVPGGPVALTPFLRYAVVVNVGYVFKVVDLSVGNGLLDLDEWVRAWVDPGTPCTFLEEPDYREVVNYWWAAEKNKPLTARPAQLCAYKLTPMFRLSWEKDIEVAAVANAPTALNTQRDAFRTLLTGRGLAVTPVELPGVLSRYHALTEDALCTLRSYQYCCTLKQYPFCP